MSSTIDSQAILGPVGPFDDEIKAITDSLNLFAQISNPSVDADNRNVWLNSRKTDAEFNRRLATRLRESIAKTTSQISGVEADLNLIKKTVACIKTNQKSLNSITSGRELSEPSERDERDEKKEEELTRDLMFDAVTLERAWDSVKRWYDDQVESSDSDSSNEGGSGGRRAKWLKGSVENASGGESSVEEGYGVA